MWRIQLNLPLLFLRRTHNSTVVIMWYLGDNVRSRHVMIAFARTYSEANPRLLISVGKTLHFFAVYVPPVARLFGLSWISQI